MISRKKSYGILLLFSVFILFGTVGCSKQSDLNSQYSNMLKDIKDAANDFKAFAASREAMLFPKETDKAGVPTIAGKIEELGNKAAQVEGVEEGETDELVKIAHDIGTDVNDYYHSDESRITRAILETGDMVVNSKIDQENPHHEYAKLRNFKHAVEKLLRETVGTNSHDTVDDSSAFRGELGKAKYLEPLLSMLKDGHRIVIQQEQIRPGRLSYEDIDKQYAVIKGDTYKYLENGEDKAQLGILAGVAMQVLPGLLNTLGGSLEKAPVGDGFFGGLFKSLIPIGKQLLGGFAQVLQDRQPQTPAEVPPTSVAAPAVAQPQHIPTYAPPQAMETSPYPTTVPEYTPVKMPFESPYRVFNYDPHYFPAYSPQAPLPPMQSEKFAGYNTFRTFASRMARPDYHERTPEELKVEEEVIVPVKRTIITIGTDKDGDGKID